VSAPVPAPRPSNDEVTEPIGQNGSNGDRPVYFSQKAYAYAEANASLLGVPLAQVISQALALQRKVIEAKHSGGRILLEKQGRSLYELSLKP
jgi:hypothetical protein